MNRNLIEFDMSEYYFKCPVCHILVKRESTASEYNILDVYTPIVQGIRAIINQLPAQEQRIINGRKRGKGAEQVCVMNMPSS
jgi:hypothetical protein